MAIGSGTHGVLLGLGVTTPITTDPDADYVLMDHDYLIGNRVQGSPLRVRGDDYSAGDFDMRPRLEVFYTNTLTPPYTWSRVNSTASEDVEVEVSDATVLSVSVVDQYPPTASMHLVVEGLKTGSTTFRVKMLSSSTTYFTSEWITVHVIGPSLYTLEQEAALDAGEPFCQKFTLIYPGGTEVLIHDETDETDAPLLTVLERGSRETRLLNFTPTDDSSLDSTSYAIVVSNENQQFSPSKTSFWGGEEPTECKLMHQCYIRVGGAWDEIEFLSYTGQIVSLSGYATAYSGVSSYEIVTSEEVGAKVLSLLFDETHAETHDTTCDVAMP